MSLIFSAISPHPQIEKDNIKKAEKTFAALNEMAGDLYVSQPEVIFIISPHGIVNPQAFCLNLANEFVSNLHEKKYKCEMELLSSIKEAADTANIAVNIISQPTLDHGIAVPLDYLCEHLGNVKIIPISTSLLNYEMHYKFGQLLRKVILNSNKRIAAIASGNLSHHSTPEGKAFNNLIINLLEGKKIKEILSINPQLIENANECALRSIVVLLGILNGSDYKFKKISYENPLGVGYLAAELI